MRSRAAIAATLVALLVALGAGSAAAARRDARVVGSFAMHGVVTVAVNVRGEHRGERIDRRWVINALGCHGGDVCNRLLVTRNRGPIKDSFVILHRIAPGEYRGHGAFWFPLECRRHRYNLGGHAPYEITLRVTARRRIGKLRYATRVSAVYTNKSRSDNTRCPLGPSYDAARYRGRLRSRLPKPPPYSLRHPRAGHRLMARSAAWRVSRRVVGPASAGAPRPA